MANANMHAALQPTMIAMHTVAAQQQTSQPALKNMRRNFVIDAMTKTMTRTLSLGLIMLGLLLATGQSALAQTVNASLGGIVSDPTGARIPNAVVVLHNQGNRDERKTTANGEGVFQFQAVPTGTYSVTITAPGFKTLTEKGIELHPNDSRNLSELKLPLGTETESITVEDSNEIPSNGERSSLITAKDIQKLSTVGRDVTELLKTQAGFSQLQTGLDNSASSSPEVVGQGSGLANYVGNGATGNGASVISDGANVTDPGNESGQTQTINMDMVAEVKIETANFGADTAKGPTVITAVGKSGTSTFHGAVHVYARAHQLNAEDWFAKYEGLPNIPDRYLYPGFEIGGPVLIPHTSFNHNRKLTFELGAEDYVQRNVYAYGSPSKSYIQALVPTLNMRNGNFSQTELGNYLGIPVASLIGTPPGQTNAGAGCSATGLYSNYYHVCAAPTGGIFTGSGTTNPSNFDPGAQALLNAEFPLPTGPTVNGYNYHQLNLENPDLYQIRTRVDLAINDNNKFYAVYNAEYGFTSSVPEQIYYSPSSGGSLQGGLDTPGKIESPSTSNTASANFTHIFSPRATNELFGAVSYVADYYYSGNQNALQKSTVGYPYRGIFGSASTEIPQLGDYGVHGLPLAITPDFSNGRYISKKFLPSGGDNFSLQVRAHTLKFGVYVERDDADQTDLSPITNGQITQYYVPTGSFTDGAGTHNTVNCNFSGCGANYLADFFMGDIDQFFQQNFNPKTNLHYWTASWFATDSWKIGKRITLDYGVRFDHLGPWTDDYGTGIAVFFPSLYASDPKGTGTLPGVRWHANDAAVPLSGTPSRFAFVSPRFGIAFDPYGAGKTMIRGGWGMYRAHDSWNDYSPSAATSQGLRIASVGGSGVSLAGVDADAAALGAPTNPAYFVCNTSGTTGCPSISVLDPNDNQQPLTMTYSFSVSQQMPGKTVFDIAYVGNQSHNLLTDAVATSIPSNLQNINAVPLGAFFKPDPNPLSSSYGQLLAPDATNVSQQNDFRPYPSFSNIDMPRHIVYANYNALQVSLNRQTGKLNFGINYTFSKSLGVRGGYANGLTGDPTNLRADYGPLAFDRTNIGAASYSYDEGVAYHGNRVLGAILNRWFISGITNLQSGPNLQAVYSPNLNLTGVTNFSYNGAACSASGGATSTTTTMACNIDNKTILGTLDITLQPTLRPSALCPSGDPTANLAKNQYVNGHCFQLPTFGVNGPTNLGYIRGPAFFNTDLTVQRTVPLGGQKNLQFRLSGFNFLNHPITGFSSRFTNEASLQLNGNDFSNVGLVNGTDPSGNCSVTGSSCFGYAGYKTGRRVLEISGRFNF